jgi:Matrixin
VHRLPLSLILAAIVLVASSANASGRPSRAPHAAPTPYGQSSGRQLPRGWVVSPDPATLATAVAESYWGATPCGGQVAVRANVPLAAGLSTTTDGWVTFDSSLGPNNLGAPAGTYSNCTISLARWRWPTQVAMQSDWNMFCLTVTHEMGHLLGHPHDLTPGSVMAPVFTDESNVPQICRSERPRLTSARSPVHARASRFRA